MTAEKDSGETPSRSGRPVVRVGNPFDADRTGRCGLACGEPIRKGDPCVIVSNRITEVRAIVHLACARKDKRLKPLLRDISVDDVFAEGTA